MGTIKTAVHAKPERGIGYIVLSFALWMIVEYVTVWHSDLARWISLMPYVFLQYLVIILTFWVLIFRRQWRERSVLLFMLATMYLLEFLWRNPLLMNPITFIPGSLLLASIWGFLTFLPLWLVRRTLRHRKLQVTACLLWIPAGFVTAIIIG